ncbi:hypothetical protein GE09DRAFT_628820, partial [Coniochaeta sp. 2T2.1]
KSITHNVNHIAIAVPDLEAAVKWYVDVLGAEELRPIGIHDRNENPHAPIFKIYPTNLNRVRIACLTTGNGVGLELFQFEDPKIEPGCEANLERDISRGGFFHMALTTDDIDGLTEKIVKNGGKVLGEKVPIYEHEAVYVEDPWGNVVELLSASFERIMSNR